MTGSSVFWDFGSLHLEASRRPTGQLLRQRQAQQVRRCDRVTQIDLAEVDCTKPQSIFSSLHGGVTRATDMRLVGKRASVYGYGEECASALRGRGSRMLFAECDPFCALQARLTVSRSRPPLRLLRTGEHGAALNVLEERADCTGVKVEGGSLESATMIVWEPRRQ